MMPPHNNQLAVVASFSMGRPARFELATFTFEA
jgi:hypothetical protein